MEDNICRKTGEEVNDIDKTCDGWERPFSYFGEKQVCKYCKHFANHVMEDSDE